MIETRPARYVDALALAPDLRLEDAAEIHATWGVDGRSGLFLCLLKSDRAFALAEGDRVLGLWGVTGVDAAGLEIGQPWMLASRRLFRRQRELARRSRTWMNRLLLDYDVLTNVTSAANTAHLRWLAWCGFRGLRVHRHHGVGGRAFCEFYHVNRLRHAADDGVRDALLHRAPPRTTRPDPALAAIVQAGIEALGGGVATLPLLTPVVQACDGAPGADQRPGAVRLLMEIAQRVMHLTEGGRSARAPLEAWCENLVAVAEVCRFGGDADPVTVLQALSAEGSGERAHAGIYPLSRGEATGMGAVAALARQVVERLTLGGRVNRVQGHRLRCAALGIRDLESVLPPGVSTSALRELWIEQRTVRDPAGRSRPATDAARGSCPGGAELLVLRLRKTVPPGVLGDHLKRALEPGRLPLPGDERLAVPEAIAVVSVIADAASRSLLPAVRLCGVVGGLFERHALYRLIRAGLLQAALPSAALRVLEREVGTLLAAGQVEASLLRRRGRFVEDDLVDLVGAVRAVLGPAALEPGADPGGPLALLLPALAVPAAHALQLVPALLAWHHVARGEVDAVLAEVSERLDENPSRRWRACNRLLRDSTRNLDMVAIRTHLEGQTTRALGRRRSSAHPTGSAVAEHADPPPARRSGPGVGEPAGAARGGS